MKLRLECEFRKDREASLRNRLRRERGTTDEKRERRQGWSSQSTVV